MRHNPIYKKDAISSGRSAGLPLAVTLFNVGMTLLVLINLYSIEADARAGGEVAYTAFLQNYYAMAGIELLLVLLITPALTASAISGERERQTLELLLTTKLRPADIICGKMMSALSATGILTACSMPVLATVFIYGGVTAGQVFLAFAVLFVCALYCAGAGICASAWMPSTRAAVAAAYVAVAVAAGLCWLVFMLRGYMESSDVWIWADLLGLLALTGIYVRLGIRRLGKR